MSKPNLQNLTKPYKTLQYDIPGDCKQQSKSLKTTGKIQVLSYLGDDLVDFPYKYLTIKVTIIERASEQIVNQKKKLTLFLIERILALISLKSKELSSSVVEVGVVPSAGLALSCFISSSDKEL